MIPAETGYSLSEAVRRLSGQPFELKPTPGFWTFYVWFLFCAAGKSWLNL